MPYPSSLIPHPSPSSVAFGDTFPRGKAYFPVRRSQIADRSLPIYQDGPPHFHDLIHSCSCSASAMLKAVSTPERSGAS